MKTFGTLSLLSACLIIFHASTSYAIDESVRHLNSMPLSVLFFALLGISLFLLVKNVKEKGELKSTLQSIPDLMFKFDLDGNYLDVYTDRPEKLAAPPDELVGKNVRDVLPLEAANVVLDALHSAQKVGVDFGRVIKLPLIHGERYFELSVSRKNDPANGSMFFALISRDVTDRKNYEKEIERARLVAEDLSNFLGERTKLLEVEVEQRVNVLADAWKSAREEEIIRPHSRLA